MPRLTPEEKEELKQLGIDVDEVGTVGGSTEESSTEADDSDSGAEDADTDENSNSTDSTDTNEKEEEREEKEDEEKPKAKTEAPDSERSSSQNETLEYLRQLEARLAKFENAEQERTTKKEPEEKKPETQKDREAAYVLTDLHLDEVNAKLARLEQHESLVLTVAKRQEKTIAENAYLRVKAKYPDFDNFITPERREKALNMVLDEPQKFGLGRNWEKEYEKSYKDVAFDSVHARANELESKREEKKNKEKRPTAKVLPSGSSFQPPVAKTSSDGPLSGYRDLRGEAARILGGE